VRSPDDLSRGVVCCSTLLAYVRPAKRVAPEALAFLASALLLFADLDTPPSQGHAEEEKAAAAAAGGGGGGGEPPRRKRSLVDVGAHPLALPTFGAAAPLSRWLRGSFGHDATAIASRVPAPLALGPAPVPSPAAVAAIVASATTASSEEDASTAAASAAAAAAASASKPAKKKAKHAAKAATANPLHETPEVSSWAALEGALGAADAGVAGARFAASALGACLRLVAAAAEPLKGSLAFAELFEPLHLALRLVRTSPAFASAADVEAVAAAMGMGEAAPAEGGKKQATVPAALMTLGQLLAAAEASVGGGVEQCLRERVPMRWQAVSKADKALVSLAPRFEEKFNADGKRSGAAPGSKEAARDEEKRLRKDMKREEKGAARELRRDASNMAKERDEEKQGETTQLQEVRHRNFGWMEEQQATINLQVRKGRGLAGGGSSIKKSVAAVLKSGKRQT
jgi:nucleolar protein 14